ncbi:MAG: hypothetical protein R2865_13330 [Deinococcales bacterium]
MIIPGMTGHHRVDAVKRLDKKVTPNQPSEADKVKTPPVCWLLNSLNWQSMVARAT